MTNSKVDLYLSETAPSIIPGTPAPDFRLYHTPNQTIALSNLRGRPVILAFYIADWHSPCRDQLLLYQEFLPEFEHFNAALLGISVDSVWSHQVFARDLKLTFPLLSDFEPKGAVAQAYGVYRPQEGINERALFIIDANGVIRWRYVTPACCLIPGVDSLLTILERLTVTENQS
jgi:peroxiredoxin